MSFDELSSSSCTVHVSRAPLDVEASRAPLYIMFAPIPRELQSVHADGSRTVNEFASPPVDLPDRQQISYLQRL